MHGPSVGDKAVKVRLPARETHVNGFDLPLSRHSLLNEIVKLSASP